MTSELKTMKLRSCESCKHYQPARPRWLRKDIPARCFRVPDPVTGDERALRFALDPYDERTARWWDDRKCGECGRHWLALNPKPHKLAKRKPKRKQRRGV